MAELLRELAVPWRTAGLVLRAFWHGCLREDWTEAQFDAAIADIYSLSRERRG